MENKLTNLNFHIQDANELWNDFENLFNETIQNHAPLKIQTRRESRRNEKPYITPQIIRYIKIKQKLFKKSIKQPSTTNWENYKSYRNKLTHIIELSKKIITKTKYKITQTTLKNSGKF